MTDADILTMLQVDLGELYPSEQRKAYLQQAIGAAGPSSSGRGSP